MSTREIRKLEKSLDKLYETWKLVRRKTVKYLGKETALHLIDFHGNNWINITSWISSEYSREEQMNINYIEFQRLFKEIHWLQFLFLHSNYPMIHRNLRYILEMMSQAYYVDWKYPGLNLNKQIVKVMEIEETIFGWKLIETVLCQILNSEKKDFKEKFKPTWICLNKHVHPSAKLMDMIAEEDFSSFVTDSFSANLAKITLEIADEIFDLIYVILFAKFSRIKDSALEYKFINDWEEYLPNTMSIIKMMRAKSHKQ